MGNWGRIRKLKKRMGYNLYKGHKVIRESDAYGAQELYGAKHPGFFKVKKTIEIDGRVVGSEWLDPELITLPWKAWEEGYKQAVRDQRKLMKEEFQ